MKTSVISVYVAAIVLASGIAAGNVAAREAAESGTDSGRKSASPVTLHVDPVRTLLKAGEKQTTWVRVGLDGMRLESSVKRPNVNLAIVLDKSGSMQGDKIEHARKAAIDALQLLGSEDIVSIVTYDSTVQVLYPATRMTDRESVEAVIRSIQADGNTALFAGVSKGAAEVRKFLDKQRVNRIVLLSDGLANSGPSTPGELGDLGASLLKEGISVSTLGLGLGYNEDLMVQLAGKSGGNHHFIEQATELADVFRKEFNSVLSVVAQDVDLQLTIPEGIRPVRVLGNDATISGQHISTRMAQIYSEQKKHIVIELELTGGESGSQRELGTVNVTCSRILTSDAAQSAAETANGPVTSTFTLTGVAMVSFSSTDDDVAKSLNKSVMADVVALVSSEENKLATRYLDEGNLEMSRRILKRNIDYLTENESLVPEMPRLRQLSEMNGVQLQQLEGVTSKDDSRANVARKSARAYQNAVDQQQLVEPPASSSK